MPQAGLQPYNQAYSSARKIFRFGFDQKASEDYHPIQLVRALNVVNICAETSASVR